MKSLTRRTFLGTTAAGAFFIPARTLYGQELPRKQLRLAMVGAGGIGAPTCDLLCKAGATVAALCDVNADALRGLTFHSHFKEFVDAAKAGDPQACGSKMAYAAPFTQALLVGAIGLRFPNRELRFDPVAGHFTNCPEANAFLQAPARGAFSMKDFA